MKAKNAIKKIGFATLMITAMSITSYSQNNWGNVGSGGSPAFTLDNVGIGAYSLPTDANLEINNFMNYYDASTNVPAFKIIRTLPDFSCSLLSGPSYPNYLEIWNVPSITPIAAPSSCGTLSAAPFPRTLLDVINNNGYLGILTAVPQAPLDVNGKGNISGALAVQGDLIDMTDISDNWRNINANSYISGLNVSAGTGGANISLNAQSASDPGTVNINSTGSGSGINFNTAMNISNAGNVSVTNNATIGQNATINQSLNVGTNAIINQNLTVNSYATIGTPSSGPFSVSSLPGPGTEYSLYVANGILAEKVKVALSSDHVNWSDFVFNKNYKLKSLGEVEFYIKTNKHLPEVPSASEVAKEGIDVASMDAKLLQKIEELTLYVIQQQKQLEQQKNEIEQLKKKMD